MNPQNQPLDRYPQPDPAASNTPATQPPQVVYITRPLDPEKPLVTPEAQKRHEEAIADYPHLNLSAGEYIISAVKRHTIGLLQIWAIGGLVVLILLAFVILLTSNAGGVVDGFGTTTTSLLPLLIVPLLFVAVVVLIGCAIGTYVYRGNTFFLTNESVIQNVQSGLFSKRLQTVSLENVEDASYTQAGILPHLLNYGSIRLSTQGDETTYRFNYASNPQKQIALLNNAVEAFKNGRPVEG